MKNKQVILLIATLVIFAIIIFMVVKPEQDAKNNKTENTISGNSLSAEEMVKNAEFTYSVSGSYKNEATEKEYSLNSIVLPYFLFETEDAKNVNKEMEKLYQTLAKEFEESLNGKKDKFVETWYDVIKVKKFLSIKVTVQRIDENGENYTYYTYVFDLDDLELLKYDNLISKLEIPNSELESKIEASIRKLDEFEDLENDELPEGKTIDDYIKATMKNYQKAKKDKSLIYFVDVLGRLNIIIPVELPDANGDMQREIKVK